MLNSVSVPFPFALFVCSSYVYNASTLGKVGMLKWVADVGGRELSLLCPLGWVDWDWDGLNWNGLSWMRVEMGWGWGWVDLGWGWGQYLCHRSATPWRLLLLVSARFPVVRLYKVTIHSNTLEVHLCTRNTCT